MKKEYKTVRIYKETYEAVTKKMKKTSHIFITQIDIMVRGKKHANNRTHIKQ